MWRHRHNVGRAVRQPDARAGERNLHHVLREIASGMHHVLVRGSDAAARGVIVSAEVRGGATAARGPQEQRQIDPAFAVDDRLGSLDHHLHLQGTGSQVGLTLD